MGKLDNFRLPNEIFLVAQGRKFLSAFTDVLHRTLQASMYADAQGTLGDRGRNAAAGINGLKKHLMVDRLAFHV